MHELMILFGTLGGIMLFGIVGVVIGPIIAALFVTVWDIYGIVFSDVLPDVESLEDLEEEKGTEGPEGPSDDNEEEKAE
jgi:predicted PurR-regulated permease PerM